MVVDPAGWSPFGPAKWTSLVVVALIGCACVATLAGPLSFSRRGLALWALFCGWAALAAALGVDPRLAWWGTPQRHFGVLTWVLCGSMFLAGQSVTGRDGFRLVMGVGTLVAGACGAWALASWAGWQPLRLAGDPRLGGPLGSASYLGAAEALLIPVALGVAVDLSWSRRARLAAGLCAGLGLFALVASGARAAWVGCLVALVVVGFSRRLRIRQAIGRRGVVSGVLAIVVAVVGLALLTGTASRVTAPFESETVGGVSRLAEWQTALRVIEEHPLVGVGPEGYRVAFGRAVDASYQRDYGRDPLPDRAHDSLLDVSVTTGLPGLVAYVGLVVLVGGFARQALRRGSPATVGLAGGLIAYGIGGLFLFPIAEIEPSAWLLAGLLVAWTAKPGQMLTLRVRRWTSGVVAAVTVAGAAFALVIGVRSTVGDQDMKSALIASSQGRDGRALALADKAVSLAPDNIVIRLAAAEIDGDSETLAGVDRGLSELSAGLSISPSDPVLGQESGALLVARAELTNSPADWRRCLAALTLLVRSDPLNPTERLQLGVAEDNVGSFGQAASQWRLAAYLAPRSAAPDADLAILYEQEGRSAAARQAATDALRIDGTDQAAQLVLDQERQ